MGIIHAEKVKDVVLIWGGTDGDGLLHFRRKFMSQFQAGKMLLKILKAAISANYLQIGQVNFVHSCV